MRRDVTRMKASVSVRGDILMSRRKSSDLLQVLIISLCSMQLLERTKLIKAKKVLCSNGIPSQHPAPIGMTGANCKTTSRTSIASRSCRVRVLLPSVSLLGVMLQIQRVEHLEGRHRRRKDQAVAIGVTANKTTPV